MSIRMCIISCILSIGILGVASTQTQAAGQDKVLHAAVSWAITETSYVYFKRNTEWTDMQARCAAFATAMVFGLAKEAIDDKFDGQDLAADAGGALIGAVFAFEF